MILIIYFSIVSHVDLARQPGNLNTNFNLGAKEDWGRGDLHVNWPYHHHAVCRMMIERQNVKISSIHYSIAPISQSCQASIWLNWVRSEDLHMISLNDPCGRLMLSPRFCFLGAVRLFQWSFQLPRVSLQSSQRPRYSSDGFKVQLSARSIELN